ncbi:UNVERIFIED_CONTAM: hypothetical protein Sindi_0371900 [Sesamum indicum]
MVVARHFHQYCQMLPRLGKHPFDHPYHLICLHTPDDAGTSGVAYMVVDDALQQSATPAVAPPPRVHQCSRTGTFPPPLVMSEAGAARAPAFLVREHKDDLLVECDYESMFRVFYILVRKYIQKTFSVARSSLIGPYGWPMRSGSNSRRTRPETEFGRPPKHIELFERCYKKKEDEGWSRPRAAEVAKTFQKMLEDHQPQPTADNLNAPTKFEALMVMTEQQMRLATVSAKNKYRVFNLGFETHVSNRTFTSSPLTPTPPSPNPAMKERISCLETMMADMMTMMREMRASSSTAASLATDPPGENQDANEEHSD